MEYHYDGIRLSQADAERFYHDMTHIDRENQNRINSFIANIDRNISVQTEGEQIIGHSDELDIADILLTLQNEHNDFSSDRNISSCVTICLQGSTSESFSNTITKSNSSASVSINTKNDWSGVDITSRDSLPLIA